MKKKALLVVAFMSVAVWANDPPYTEPDTGIVRTICINDPDNNTGVCRKKTLIGAGFECVTAKWYETKNCYKTAPDK